MHQLNVPLSKAKNAARLQKEELVADGLVMDIEYCAKRKEFAYASADKQAYIRAFAVTGTEMVLKCVLQGHEAEVTQVHGSL